LKYFLIFLYSFSALSAPNNFGVAKTALKEKVYLKKSRTFYCDCEYQKQTVKLKDCKLNTKHFKKRQTRLEWEHIVPVAAFGHSFKEYREYKTLCARKGKRALSPRKCASKLNPLFREMEGNVHNLVPAVGAINALRSHFSFKNLGEKAELLCEKGMRLLDRKVEPPKNRKGDVARIYLYMNEKYPNRGIVSKANQSLFSGWNLIDPVDNDECLLHELKSKIQADSNPFVITACAALLHKN